MKTRNSHHHLHAIIPLGLWQQFRALHPAKGDVSKYVALALEVYLNLKKDSRHMEPVA